MTSSTANILAMPTLPSEVAISSAIKVDLHTLVKRHVEHDAAGMGYRNRVAEDHLKVAVALDLIAGTVDEKALEVIRAIVECERDAFTFLLWQFDKATWAKEAVESAVEEYIGHVQSHIEDMDRK